MISMWAILAILSTHYLADFVCQSRRLATRKSFDNRALWTHAAQYALWFTPVALMLPHACGVVFLAVTALAHGLTDYVTSRQATAAWLDEDMYRFWVIIGFDQWVHVLTLLLTYLWLA
jgi:hypothetical protein